MIEARSRLGAVIMGEHKCIKEFLALRIGKVKE